MFYNAGVVVVNLEVVGLAPAFLTHQGRVLQNLQVVPVHIELTFL
jgi:hypothetical protein